MTAQDDLEVAAGAAARLEAALERIAHLATASIIRASRETQAEASEQSQPPHNPGPEIAARLDDLIARLRAVLGEV